MMIELFLYIALINPNLGVLDVDRYARMISVSCQDPYMAASVIGVESMYQSQAINVNSNGTIDVGLFQINSVHGIDEQLLRNPYYSIAVGCDKLNSGKFRHSNKKHIQDRYNRRVLELILRNSL